MNRDKDCKIIWDLSQSTVHSHTKIKCVLIFYKSYPFGEMVKEIIRNLRREEDYDIDRDIYRYIDRYKRRRGRGS